MKENAKKSIQHVRMICNVRNHEEKSEKSSYLQRAENQIIQLGLVQPAFKNVLHVLLQSAEDVEITSVHSKCHQVQVPSLNISLPF